MASLSTGLCICLFAKQTRANCTTELAYVFKLSIQMFLCPKPATQSVYKCQDVTLKAVIICWSIRGTPNRSSFGYCLQTGSKKAWKGFFNNAFPRQWWRNGSQEELFGRSIYWMRVRSFDWTQMRRESHFEKIMTVHLPCIYLGVKTFKTAQNVLFPFIIYLTH